MTKLRKQRRRKVYRHNINRKRLRNKIYSVGNIGCKEVKNAWESSKSVETNLTEMGLSYNPNKTIKIPNSKKEFKASLLSNKNDWNETVVEEQPSKEKLQVVEVLEADAKAPRERRFQLPKGQVEWITYLMKKYGKDYKAMARDIKNYNQETWKQIRQKIKRFKRIPQQYSKYLEENNLELSDSESLVMSDEEF
ncbi:nucleolar protein 16 [Anoplophora glabripennis]|uniref:nucleolar protein 16 n=1 Tax=Anoplophora glabripennis TaxID=217634 RepID=UPI0008735A12|nr:nucleolar protein 16 [Anoplophora glabripennis]